MTFILAAALGAAPGCDDFATPAELSKVQVLGIASHPASVQPGQSATLDILVAGPEGEILSPAITWSVAEPAPMVPAIGTVQVDAEGTATYTAPASVPENPTLAAVQATVHEGDQPLLALKGMIITTIDLENPTLDSFTATGTGTSDLLSADLIMSPGDPITLEVSTVPALGERAQVSWYSTIGTIERYRSNPTELVADDPGQGWIFVVVRDGLGGITWSKARVRVE